MISSFSDNRVMSLMFLSISFSVSDIRSMPCSKKETAAWSAYAGAPAFSAPGHTPFESKDCSENPEKLPASPGAALPEIRPVHARPRSHT